MNTFVCASCEKSLAVSYWKDGHPFCNIHCWLNWMVLGDIRKAQEAQSQLLLHLTDDNPLTTEAM